jgi:hypothetical protein
MSGGGAAKGRAGSPAGVIKGAFRRVTGPHGSARFTDQAPAPPETRPARAARMLAVAHALADILVKDGAPRRADLAKALDMSEARLSQLLDLVLLAPDIQEQLLFLEVAPGRDSVPERALRDVVRALDWQEQRRRWCALMAQRGQGTRDVPARGPAQRPRISSGVLCGKRCPQSVDRAHRTP